MNQILKYIFQSIGWLFSWILPTETHVRMHGLLSQLYVGIYKRRFANWGTGSTLGWRSQRLNGLKYISVGNNTTLESDIQLTAWEKFRDQTFHPTIKIGNFCCIRRDAHITAVGQITIGNNVLTGTNVLISDNSHGNSTYKDMELRPEERPLVGKGPITIEDNVWLGNNVCVLGGVTIGKGAIVGANAVVTNNLPPYCIAAGVPAKVIKIINPKSNE